MFQTTISESSFTGWVKQNWIKHWATILIVWQLLFSFYLTHPMLCDCDIEGKGLLLLCISKWFRRETIKWNFLHFFARNAVWVKPQIIPGCFAQPSTQSRCTWPMAKVSTDKHAAVKKLLLIGTNSRPLLICLLTPLPSFMRFLIA